MKKILFCFCFLFPVVSFGQDSLKVMFYNLYRFPVNPPEHREFILQEIIAEAQPDLLLACEIINKDGSDRILNTSFRSLPDSFAAPEFVYCSTATDDPLQQMAYYNTRKLTLIKQETLHTIIRDINHYTFYLNQTDLNTSGDTVFLEAFVTHLKAGNGNAESSLRATMADTFVKALEKIPSGHHVLLAGDFNFYDDTEPALRILTDTTNAIVMIDPIQSPGEWHDNADFKNIHTQATRKTLGGFGLGGASGGMDDRFDFILMSRDLVSNNRLYYLPGSYVAYGNNGNCFNMAINNDTCVGKYALPLRNLLFQMSDHTPVMMTLMASESFPSLGVKSILPKSNEWLVLPEGNVAHTQLKIQLNHTKGKRWVYVYDLTGRVLKKLYFAPGQQYRMLNTEGLAEGIYYVRSEGAVKRFLKK